MIKTFSGGLLDSNTYLFYDESSLQGMLIDCGHEVGEIERFCREHNIFVKYIVLTHGHYDHADFVKAYKSRFTGATVVAHKDEKAVLSDPRSKCKRAARSQRHLSYAGP